MSEVLPDGTVIPSNLSFADIGGKGRSYSSGRTAMMVGQIRNRYPPSNKDNRSKKFYEYDVQVVEGGVGQSGAILHLPHCLAISGFGNDKSYRTIRKGTYVYVLCVWGATTQGIIIGGVPTQPQKTEAGEHLTQSFNGMEATVNNDGELTITYTGAQTDKGTTDATAAGTTVKINKEGSVIIDDGAGQKLTIDKTAKTVTVEAASGMTQETTGPWTVRAPMVSIEAQSTVAITAPGGVAIAGPVAVSGAMSVAGPAGGPPSPAVKGDAVVAALNSLIVLLLANAATMCVTGSSPGQPTPMNPALAAALAAWQAQWVGGGALLAPGSTTAP